MISRVEAEKESRGDRTETKSADSQLWKGVLVMSHEQQPPDSRKSQAASAAANEQPHSASCMHEVWNIHAVSSYHGPLHIKKEREEEREREKVPHYHRHEMRTGRVRWVGLSRAETLSFDEEGEEQLGGEGGRTEYIWAVKSTQGDL